MIACFFLWKTNILASGIRKTMKSIIRIQLLMFMCIVCCGVESQAQVDNDDAGLLIQNYVASYPQEKIFLHTDKTSYLASDTMWYRAYLVDALANVPVTNSRYIYVELRDMMADTLLTRDKIKCDSNGVFSNNMLLPASLPSGDYLLSAYTRWMSNFDESRFFSKIIRVTNAYKNTEPDSAIIKKHTRKKVDVQENDFDFAMMPEGGNLISGVWQRVAYKAVDNDGLGIDVKVSVISESGDTLQTSQSEHLGMGMVLVNAIPDQKLYVEAQTADGRTQKIEMPEAESGVSLSVTQSQKYIVVSILNTPDVNVGNLILVIFNGDNLFVKNEVANNKIVLPTDDLCSGIFNVALADRNTFEIVAERCVFIRDRENATVEIDDSHFGEHRELVTMPIHISGSSPAGTYSVSVTDETLFYRDTLQSNAVSYLLLSSELKGFVEKPNYYFENITPKVDNDLDLLMMTQAWRRYNVSEILSKQSPDIVFEHEHWQSIRGKVGGLYTDKKKSPSVIMLSPQLNLRQIFEFENNTNFNISELDFPDSTGFFFEAVNRKGKSNNVHLSIYNDSEYPSVSAKNVVSPFISRQMYDPSKIWVQKLNIMNEVLIGEVTVVAKANINKPLNLFHVEPSKSVTKSEFERFGDMVSVMRYLNAPIFQDEYGEYKFNGKLYLNDADISDGSFSWIPPRVLKKAEYMSEHDPSATSMFGTSSQPVLLLYTIDETDASYSDGPAEFAKAFAMPKGWKKPVEFYSPKYTTTERQDGDKDDIRSTVYWNPALKVGADGNATIQFYMPDNNIVPVIDVQGVSDAGVPVAKMISKE